METQQDRGLAVAVDAGALARVGTALADETRRRLLLALLEAPAYPSELADRLGLTRGNVSNHLSCLRGCGLVKPVPDGRRVRYELADPKLAHALADLAALVLLVDHQGKHDQACDPDGACCASGDETPGHARSPEARHG
ncbi:metalloregulator ArsR/SmtB family transcription factor [Streptomyces sp. L-9-10]|uniref:ArsR/SmtB family transcription factor n=1 Tax=Streptomyces sp. L-9-10 TaxID=1478131 RepID=UPI00101D3C42|nr:metalloregulator ArsR/SmtB family transcription factor [Streptomyces sp. L-9-10]